MESPPSVSTNSDAPPLSEDSGLLITSGSFSSDSASGWHHVASELQESDFDERSLSFCESTETSERMGGEFFNTVKKGPGKIVVATIDPPPEFQDHPLITSGNTPMTPSFLFDDVDDEIVNTLELERPRNISHVYPKKFKPEILYERRQSFNPRFPSPRLLPISPCRPTRPSSRNSLSSRLSSSHNSLVTQLQIDDSSFITQAISHDTLSSKGTDITDMYNVPFDSDIYAVPIDTVRPNQSNLKNKGKKQTRPNKKRGKSTPQNLGSNNIPDRYYKKETKHNKDSKTKRHSLPSSSCKQGVAEADAEPAHLTLHEMRKYLHTLYSSSSDSDCLNMSMRRPPKPFVSNVPVHSRASSRGGPHRGPGTAVFLQETHETSTTMETNNNHKKSNKNSFSLHKSKKLKDSARDIIDTDKSDKLKKSSSKISHVRILSLNLKQSFCNLFRWRKHSSADNSSELSGSRGASAPTLMRRALPPLPQTPRPNNAARRSNDDENMKDFAASLEKVKDYPWYWGPLSVEAAEKILSNEPDGSFIVRDSSDDHYIFTLTFKLNGLRHVRIEHDQGNFCFGGCTMFKATTIVEFIENAVETSRSGRYLFFLNLRPLLGPVRVQLLYPVSRFKRVQGLQHMCRFVILKHVRRDLINSLPLPRRLLDYLSATHYYSELLTEI